MISLLADIEKASGCFGKKTRRSPPVREVKTTCAFRGCENPRMRPGQYATRKTPYSYCTDHFSYKNRDKSQCKKD